MTVAAVTMVWNDDFFLKVWLDYFVPRVGARNIFVINHGGSEETRRLCGDCNVIDLPRDPDDWNFDWRRWDMLSQFVSGLCGYYDTVLCLDVDELVFPVARNQSLDAYFSGLPSDANYCVPGFDLYPDHQSASTGEKLGESCAGALFSTFYSKSCIAKKPVRFSPGAHGLVGEAPQIASGAVLFHLKNMSPTEAARRNDVRESMTRSVYKALDEEGYVPEESERPLLSWRNANRRATVEEAKFHETAVKKWDAVLVASQRQLHALRVQDGDVFRFRRHPRRALRADIPDWMSDLF